MAARSASHMDNIQKPAKSPHYLLREVPQPSEGRLSETKSSVVLITKNPQCDDTVVL